MRLGGREHKITSCITLDGASVTADWLFALRYLEALLGFCQLDFHLQLFCTDQVDRVREWISQLQLVGRQRGWQQINQGSAAWHTPSKNLTEAKERIDTFNTVLIMRSIHIQKRVIDNISYVTDIIAFISYKTNRVLPWSGLFDRPLQVINS